jgi:iron complex transport system substrate-binding protein
MITFEALVHSKPDIASFALCGLDVTRACQEIQKAWSPEQNNQPGELCHDHVYIVDGNFLINRSGPRVVECAEVLAVVERITW